MEQKPYLVIARKYRPLGFDDVVGQDPVVTTLKNAVASGRIGHAYLFTGPRGVGKTSMARILAKALNCRKGPTADPCGECPACLEIEQGRSLDVLEIDGASNRGIDEIRALRENVKFAPAAGKFKIYIIDEVHQITTDGFNALLKTLEEPPAHVKFIFATTSAHKVPATILSRCQRFDFRRIPTDTIAETLKTICKKEKIKIEEEALFLIARAADGSFRDSQSILDQMASSSKGEVTARDVTRSLGALEEEKLIEMTDALLKKDAPAALVLLDGLLQDGKDVFVLLEKLLEHVRNLLYVHVSEKLAELVDASESYKKALLRQKTEAGQEDLFYMFSVLSHALQTMKRFDSKRIPLEIALVKLARRVPMKELSTLLDELKSAEKKTPLSSAGVSEARPLPKIPVRPTVSPKISAPKTSRMLDDDREADIEELPSDDIVPAASLASDTVSLNSVWQPLITAVKVDKISIAAYLAEGEPLGFQAGVVRIAFPEHLSFHRETLEMPENRRLIEKHLSALLGRFAKVEFELIQKLSGSMTAKVAEENEKPPVPPGAVETESVKSAVNIFGGKIVR